MTARKGSYGFDALYVPALMTLGSLALLAGAVLRALAGDRAGVLSMGASGLLLLCCAASYVYTTRWGKFAVWSSVLDALALRGDERVLDVGCGRGAVLLLAAQRLPRGKVTGIDLWSAVDQSGNALATTERNAQLEGVAERVELHTGDMRALPFDAACFELVVSSLAIHNVADAAERKKAVREMVRVLKPGGRVAIADFRHAGEYAAALRAEGMSEVKVRGLGARFWYGGPWAATSLVTGRKAG